MNEAVEVSATEWEHLHFYGITSYPLSEVGLNQQMAQGLINMVGAGASICTGALIAPKFLINQKGTTPWLAMFALLAARQPALLQDIHKGEAAAFIPNDILESLFIDHNNWPAQLWSQYNIELKGFNVFVLPFLVPKGSAYNLHFEQSMKAPDGSLEVFGANVFDENQPEKLLLELQSILEFINLHRPDIVEQ
ncbi:hypothetical protein [Pleionea sp. CnH1-48]|uniref:hypothetical protein n=1 Tax=Pleionea sp. CnH1-48 TaxID=2954494 RepID=UPI002097F6FE|nr:hypothetical protein [Pleionea sp. CnH1-48]MCO7223519.1 hypothetical protein [Pleionea sp. CnH1-48]